MANKKLSDAEKAERVAKRAEAFVKLAEARMTKALDAISKLRNLGASTYVSTEAQRKAIIVGLENAVVQVANSLNGTTKDSTGFSLADAVAAVTPAPETEEKKA